MARSGDVFTFSGAISTWAGPATADVPSISGWNALRDELVAGLSDSFSRSGSGTMAGPFLAASGTITAPGISFSNDPDTGFYPLSANVLGLSLGNSLKYSFSAASVVTNNDTGVPTNATTKSYVDTQVATKDPLFTKCYASYYRAAQSVSSNVSTGALTALVTPLNASENGAGVITVTPAGKYRIEYTLECIRSSGSADFTASIYVGGVQQVYTIRNITGSSSIKYHIHYAVIVDLAGSSTITVQYTHSAGTMNVTNCTINIHRVA